MFICPTPNYCANELLKIVEKFAPSWLNVVSDIGAQLMPDETKNIFISHIHEDDDGLPKLRELLGRSGVVIRDGSINSDKPNNAEAENYIKYDIIAPRIRWCSTLVVYISPKTKDSWWVNWEIEFAQREGKRIVGVWERGSNGCDVPDALKDHYDALVGWHGDSIADAILGDKDKSEFPNGAPTPNRPIKRHPC